MRVYLDLGHITGGASLVDEESIRALIRRWYYSREEIWKNDDNRLISVKIIDIVHTLMLAEPNVNGGKYFALIDGLNISVFYSRNSINELHLHTFSECKEEVNEAGRLPMFEVKVFCKESLKSSFSGFGIFRIGVKECVCKKLDEEILSAARKFWEDISRSASEESYVVHAQKKGALSDGESFQ